MIEYLSLTQPNLDTKPGTVSRDLFIDLQADQLDKLYKVISMVSDKQSPERMVGKDIDRWASNYKLTRKTGAPSYGIVVFTFNDLRTDIPIPDGTVVTSRSGLAFKTIGSYNVSIAEKSRYAANASRLRPSLNIAGISDQYAIEVPVQALRNGRAGDISSLQIVEHNLQDSLRVTNLTSFSGGENTESDSTFLARINSSFSGVSTGTSFGYRSAVLNVSGINDALVVQPGNSLMLRDGTETIQTNDGTFRVLSSGTGGKVDVYILGRKTEEVVQTFVYTDLSGKGVAEDERNDIIPGVNISDLYRTNEERRIIAINTGQLPLQPVDSIVSLTGSSSGLFAQKAVDASGNVSGNYELIKDLNVSTGGSPFGVDRIRFISSEKDVSGQTTLKKVYNSVDGMKYSDVKDLQNVYQNINILRENSRVSPSDKGVVYLNHSPIVTVSRVINRTTGEIYTITNQNTSDETGLNELGWVRISGKSLPSSADILSVDYTWRCHFDRFIDYNGEESPAIFKDENVVDSIDWGVSNGIFSEQAVIYQNIGESEYLIDLQHNISRVVSVYAANELSLVVSLVESESGEIVPGIEVPMMEPEVENIISIKSESGVECYATSSNDGYFISRIIYLPTDTSIGVGDNVVLKYNKVELFDIPNNDGTSSTNTITLPSQDILQGNDLLTTVDNLYLSSTNVYIDYVADISIMASVQLSSLPLSGADSSNFILDSNSAVIADSTQPVIFEFDGEEAISISKFGPTRIKALLSGTARAGKLKMAGTTLTRINIVASHGSIYSNGKYNVYNEILNSFGAVDQATSYIARIDSVKTESGRRLDIIGSEISNNIFSKSTSYSDDTLGSFEFRLPQTPLNMQSISSGEKIIISLLVAKENDFEELYFPGDLTIYTKKVFARLSSVSISSGFRANNSQYSGVLTLQSFNQPATSTNYFVDYSFSAPKEGERLTLRYLVNRLVSDATLAVEDVRTVTADVLVKEAERLPIDVRGEVVISDGQQLNEQSILDNVSNAIVSALNTNVLGATIDYSDIIAVATSVGGVDSFNLSLFNEAGKIGRRSFIKALDNQNLVAGQVSVIAVSRRDFKIS